jgi:VWFA-related protein
MQSTAAVSSAAPNGSVRASETPDRGATSDSVPLRSPSFASSAFRSGAAAVSAQGSDDRRRSAARSRRRVVVRPARTDAAQGAAVLADDTGGVIVRNTNDLAKGLGRLFDTMESYYVIGYEHAPQSKAAFRQIKVETRAKDVTVRARRGYFDAAPARR